MGIETIVNTMYLYLSSLCSKLELLTRIRTKLRLYFVEVTIYSDFSKVSNACQVPL